MDELIHELEREFIHILEILKSTQLTNFKTYMMEQRLAEIAGVLNNLSQESYEIINKYFTILYKKDMITLNRFLEKHLTDYNFIGFGGIHIDSLKTIITDTYNLIGTGLQFTMDSSRKILQQSVKEALLKSSIEGLTLYEAKKILNKKIEQIGLNCLVDRGGHKWELPRYSEMVIRTQMKNVHKEVTINAAVDGGYDAVIITCAPDCCELCEPWDEKILSLRSEAPDWCDGTLEEAELDGLFHPNCRCVATPYVGDITDTDNLGKEYEDNETFSKEDEELLETQDLKKFMEG